jgi:hypothetical protein
MKATKLVIGASLLIALAVVAVPGALAANDTPVDALIKPAGEGCGTLDSPPTSVAPGVTCFVFEESVVCSAAYIAADTSFPTRLLECLPDA